MALGPTSNQADRIRELRERNEKRHPDMQERTWFAGHTQPYGDMVVLFEWPRQQHPTFQGYAYLVHPDGHYHRLDSYRIPDHGEVQRMSDEVRVIRRLTFASFQADAKPTGHVPQNPLWPALALGGEAGELLNVRKKIERDEPDRKRVQLGPVPQLDLDFLEEAGDILFYLRLALLERGFTLEDAAAGLLDKLWSKHLCQLVEGATVRVTANANQPMGQWWVYKRYADQTGQRTKRAGSGRARRRARRSGDRREALPVLR